MTNLQIKYIKKKKVKRIYLKKKIIKTIIIPRYLIILKKILKIFLKNQTTIKKNIKMKFIRRWKRQHQLKIIIKKLRK